MTIWTITIIRDGDDGMRMLVLVLGRDMVTRNIDPFKERKVARVVM